MSFTIAFYVHHHGSGHLMRCLSIAKAIKSQRVMLIGSSLMQVDEKAYPNIELVHLPADLPGENENNSLSDAMTDAFHYAPTGLRGIRERNLLLTELFSRYYPLLLVVDVSVEIALLARLCGIPTIVMRQHGIRNDLPHSLAYQSAELLIAPFSVKMYRGEHDWAYHKTFFSGGFSRFQTADDWRSEQAGHIAILIGAGGSSIEALLIREIAADAPDYTFHILGNKEKHPDHDNIHWHGQLDDPSQLLNECEIVLGNTGHNTVMEAATLNKRFVGIPEDRPFEEQKEKAAAISAIKGVKIIPPEQLSDQNWQSVFDELSKVKPDWTGMINPKALEQLAEKILNTGYNLFSPQ